jgi:hypothetical protein
LQLEVIYLRKQIEILQRTCPKVKTKKADRLFFGLMKNLLSTWKDNLFIVKPETLINWHRKEFRIYWKWISKKKTAGLSRKPGKSLRFLT